VLFNNVDTAKMHGLDTSSVSSRAKWNLGLFQFQYKYKLHHAIKTVWLTGWHLWKKCKKWNTTSQSRAKAKKRTQLNTTINPEQRQLARIFCLFGIEMGSFYSTADQRGQKVFSTL